MTAPLQNCLILNNVAPVEGQPPQALSSNSADAPFVPDMANCFVAPAYAKLLKVEFQHYRANGIG